jgi:hypothetical protein
MLGKDFPVFSGFHEICKQRGYCAERWSFAGSQNLYPALMAGMVFNIHAMGK